MDEETKTLSTETVEPTTDNDALNAAALAAAEKADQAPTSEEGLPSDGSAADADYLAAIPDKFKNEDGTVNVEHLAKSYTEIEKLNSTKEAPAEDAEDKAPEEDAPEGDDALSEQRSLANDVLTKAGLSLEDMQTQYNENGGFTDEMYRTLEEKAGLPKALVETWEQGLKSSTASSALMETLVHEAAGGADAYTEVQDWGADNLADFELEAYNAAVGSDDPSVVLNAFKALKARKESSEVLEPSATLQGRGASATGSTYANAAEKLADMQDPRYDTDEGFRLRVQQKALRSDV